MKLAKKIFIISFLLLILIYVTNITSIPSNIVLFEGESLKINTILGVNLQQNNINVNKNELNEYVTVETSSTINDKRANIGKTDFKLNLFGKIPLKDVTVNVLPKASVIPLGNAVRIKTIYEWSFSGRNDADRRK